MNRRNFLQVTLMTAAGALLAKASVTPPADPKKPIFVNLHFDGLEMAGFSSHVFTATVMMREPMKFHSCLWIIMSVPVKKQEKFGDQFGDVTTGHGSMDFAMLTGDSIQLDLTFTNNQPCPIKVHSVNFKLVPA